MNHLIRVKYLVDESRNLLERLFRLKSSPAKLDILENSKGNIVPAWQG